MSAARSLLIWMALAVIAGAPLILAGMSPLLAWREPVYIIAGFAGIIAMILILFQPLLAAGLLPALSEARSRIIHRTIGISVILMVIVHVVGLWITSPPDVVDALLLRSPTPFSLWGVIAMWAVFAAGLLAALRRPVGLRWRTWRKGHVSLAVVIVGGTVLHALLIDGTMETVSKIILSGAVIGAAGWGIFTRLRGR